MHDIAAPLNWNTNATASLQTDSHYCYFACNVQQRWKAHYKIDRRCMCVCVCAVSVLFVDNKADRSKCICPLLSFIFASTLPAIQRHSIDIRFASHRQALHKFAAPPQCIVIPFSLCSRWMQGNAQPANHTDELVYYFIQSYAGK